MHKNFPLLALLVLGACASTAPERSGDNTCDGNAMIETQLFFGLSRPNGGTVSESEWNAFVQSEILPRFAEGFSVVDNTGFWLDGQSKLTIMENSKIVSRLQRPGDTAEIAQIINSYKSRFAQESVLRIDTAVCAKF